MKKWMIWPLLITLMLCGCTEQPQQQTTAPTVQTTMPDPGCYLAESAIEQQTGGAVRAYEMEQTGLAALDFMGGDVLAFFSDGNVSRLTGENCTVAAQTVLPAGIFPDGVSVKAYGNALAYYSTQEKSVVYLNESLQIYGKSNMPQQLMGSPILSEDLRTAYYCAGQELFGVDLASGISRIIRSQSLTVCQNLFNDTVLRCFISDAAGGYTEFLSSQTGATLGGDATLESIDTFENRYLLIRMDGIAREILFGVLDEEPSLFLPAESGEVISALSMYGAVTLSSQEDGSVMLAYYDLAGGKCTSRITLPACEIFNVCADDNGSYIWFIYRDPQGKELLCRWDVSVKSAEDQTVYTSRRYTLSQPDEQGIAQCQERAKEIFNKYGVKVSILNDVKQPENYTLVYEHQVEAIQKGLDAVDAVLAMFPQDYLQITAKISDTRMIHIGLVRAIHANNPETAGDPYGLQYWANGNASIALCVNEDMQSVLIHEISHVMDAYIFSKSVLYDDWDRVNPEGFQYDNNYTDYSKHTNSVFLKENTRAFIDAYSMSFAKEDRAKILEYAMTEGNEEYFATSFMQNKLMRICKAIRDAYKWKKDPRVFPWEQYLRKSLAYIEK